MFSLGGYLGKWIFEIEALPLDVLIEYMAMANISPFGDERADLRTGYAAAMSYNLTRPTKARAMKVSEFIPQFERKRQSAMEMAAKFRIFAEAHNARLEK